MILKDLNLKIIIRHCRF